MSEFNNREPKAFHLLRGQLVESFLFSNTVLGLPTLLASVSRTSAGGWKSIFLIQVVIYMITVITVLLRKRLSLDLRIYSLLFQLFVLGVTGLISYGFLGSGLMILMTFCIIATLLLGIRRGMYLIVVSLITLTIIGGLFMSGRITVNVDAAEYQSSMISWLSKLLGFTLFTATISSGFNKVYHYLSETLEEQKKSSLSLELANKSLKAKNEENETLLKAFVGRELKMKELKESLKEEKE